MEGLKNLLQRCFENGHLFQEKYIKVFIKRLKKYEIKTKGRMNRNSPSETNSLHQNSQSSEDFLNSSEQLQRKSIFGYSSDSCPSSVEHNQDLNPCRTIFSQFQASFPEQRNQKVKTKLTLAGFQGRGITEWYGPHPSGPSRELHQIEGKSSVNVFDRISVSFRIKLFQDSTKCSEIIEFYELLEQNIKAFKHQIRMGKGNAYFNVGNYVMAENQFLKAERARKTQKVYENLTFVYRQLFHHQKCIYNAGKCLKINKRNVYAQFWMFIQQEDLASIVKLSEENPSYYYLYAFLASQFKQPPEKLKVLKKIPRYNPDYPQYHITLAKMLEEPWKNMKLKNLAKRHYQNSQYYYEFGGIFFGYSQFNESIHQFEKSLKLNPYHYMAAFRLGQIYLILKKSPEAIKYFKLSLQINPKCQKLRTDIMQFCQKHDADKKQMYSMALDGLTFHPKNKLMLRVAAVGLIKNQLFDRALQCLLLHDELEPHKKVDRMISACYLSLDQMEEGLDYALRSIQKGNQYVIAICRKTIDYLVKGNHQEALLEWLLQLATIVLDQSYYFSFGISLGYIMVNIKTHYLKGKERGQVATALQRLAGSLEEAFKNRFKFLIVGKILMELQCERQSAVYFGLVRKLIRNRKYEQIIYLYLGIFFGSIQRGLISYQQKRKRQALKGVFKNSFASQFLQFFQ